MNKICTFFHDEETFFNLARRYGSPEGCLSHLCRRHKEITYAQLIDLYQAFDKRSTSSSSTTLNPDGPRQRQASPIPVQAKQKKDKEEKKEDDESNTSDEFKQLQAKCDNPKGTTYRLREKRTAPVSPAAATEGESDDDRAEAERKEKLEASARIAAAPTPSEGDGISGDEASGREEPDVAIKGTLANSQVQFMRNPSGPASARTTSDLMMLSPPAPPASDRSNSDHDSDPNPPEAPLGPRHRRRRHGMPRGEGRADKAWEGPKEGDDKDESFLVDYASNYPPGSPRTGRARIDERRVPHSRDEWSPETGPERSSSDTQQEREEQHQDADQTAIEADDDEEKGLDPRAKLTSKPVTIADSSSTRPTTGKGIGERSRHAITRSRSRSRSPLPRPYIRDESVEEETGKRKRTREESDTPPRKRLKGKQKPQKGKGYNPEQKGLKSKDKSDSKITNKSKEHPKGKGHKQKHAHIDDPDKLSDSVKLFHENISSISIDDGRQWKYEVFKHYKIIENVNHRNCVMDNCVQHVRDLRGKDSNKRLYIGPGRDGSSDNKISVDVKFNSNSTKVAENPFLKEQGYCKTSFAYGRDAKTQVDTWQIIEDQEELENEYLLSDKTSKMVIIIHPMYSTAEEDAKKTLPADMAKTQQQTEPDGSPTQDGTKKDLDEEEDEANYEANEGDDSLSSDVRTTIMKEGEIDQADL